MDVWKILLEMLILFGAAFLLGTIAERFRQNAVIGYLAAGAIVGPHALNMITGVKEVSYISELGVALLLFSIGLEFSFSRLRRLGATALGGGAIQVISTIAVATLISILCGFGIKVSITLGAIAALSSTACVLRLLADRSEIDSVHGRYALGILLFQDIAVVPLILLITLLGQGGGATETWLFLGRTVAAAAGLGVGFYILFSVLTPRILLTPQLKHNQELSVILAILIGVGATWAAHEVGLSPAMGAFLAGMLLAESPFAMQVRAGVSGLKSVFIVLFFSSAGMYTDPTWLVSNALLVVVGIVSILFGKTLITTLSLVVFRAEPLHAMAAGFALGQIGEFSFLLATTAATFGLISGDLLSFIFSVTVGTLFLSSYQVSWSMPVAGRLFTLFKKKSIANEKTVHDHENRPVLIIGYGPAGRRVAQELKEKPYSVEVLDLNAKILKSEGEKGLHLHVGDASHPEILEHAGVAEMRAVVVTVPDANSSRNIVERIRTLAPHVPLIVRARYNRFIPDLKRSGANIIVDEEWEVGHRLAEETCRAVESSDTILSN